jgi:hypothetical protein
MKYYCTICSKEKRNDKELLPAIERYLSPRVKSIYKKASLEKVKLLIFSGEYGFLYPHSLIPFYDHLLLKDEVESFLPILRKQNFFLEITELECFMERMSVPGWEPYYTILKRFAEEENVKISFSLYEK